MNKHPHRLAVDRASRRPSPLPVSDFTRAERLFTKPALAPSSFKQFKIDVLAELCRSKGILLDPAMRQRKDDYIAAIRAAHSERALNTTPIGVSPTSTSAHPAPVPVLVDVVDKAHMALSTHNPSASLMPTVTVELTSPEFHPAPNTAQWDGAVPVPWSEIIDADQEMLDADQGIVVRLYKQRNDWHPVDEILYHTPNGDVYLADLRGRLGCPEGFEIQVLHPKRHRPLYAYHIDRILHEDVVDLMEDGYLRTVFAKRKKSAKS